MEERWLKRVQSSERACTRYSCCAVLLFAVAVVAGDEYVTSDVYCSLNALKPKLSRAVNECVEGVDASRVDCRQ